MTVSRAKRPFRPWIEILEDRLTPSGNAPIGTANTVTTLEDTPYTVNASDFGFTDPNDNPADAFVAVKVASLPIHGILSLDGVDIVKDQFVSIAHPGPTQQTSRELFALA